MRNIKYLMKHKRQKDTNPNMNKIRSQVLYSSYLKPLPRHTMGISINTNIAATKSGFYLANNHQAMQKSLDRLSSGKRITEPADDAGGLAVSMKIESTIKRLRATSYNVTNAVSLLQVQDGVLASAAKIVSRMGELKSMHNDVTKNTTDQAAYDNEFNDLQGQLWDMAQTKFNGIRVFGGYDAEDNLRVADNVFGTDDGHADSTLELFTTEDGSSGPSVLVEQSLLLSGLTLTVSNANTATEEYDPAAYDDAAANPAPVAGVTQDGTFSLASSDPTDANKIFSLGDINMEFFTAALQNLATMRATNGGMVKNLQYTLDNIETQIINHQAANGRIMDVDVARESSNLAKQQVLVQSAATMTAQANLINDVALMLIRGN
jgi:flagellin